jgi:hypothetical protein
MSPIDYRVLVIHGSVYYTTHICIRIAIRSKCSGQVDS